MIQMIIYSITIFYTPGPVSITAANIGLTHSFKKGISFYAGVSVAIFTLYMLLGYFGNFFLGNFDLWPIHLLGGIYMLYLAYKIFFADFDLNKAKQSTIGFREGFIMQIFNPKAMIAVLPVITIYFPKLHIEGIKIFYMAIFFMVLVFGSPAIYGILGQFFSQVFQNKKVIRYFNKTMALILGFIAISILYQHVFLDLMKS